MVASPSFSTPPVVGAPQGRAEAAAVSRSTLRSPAFHREVADAIVRVWRQRQQFYGYDVFPNDIPSAPVSVHAITPKEPGILAWAPSVKKSAPRLSTVTEMTAAIGRAYDAVTHSYRNVVRVPSEDASLEKRLALWVVAVGDLGGVARHVLDATRVGIPGWRVVVLCPEGPLASQLRAQGSAVLTTPISPADSLAGGVAAVRHAVRTLRPAVVHSHLAYSDFLVAGATIGSPTRGVPRLVTTEHGIAGNDLVYHGTRLRSRVMELAHAARLRRFDALIAVSDATLDAVYAKWHPAPHSRAVVIPNGVDTVADVPVPPPGRLHVVSLSRLAPEKGLGDLLEAFALVHGGYPEARLTLAGKGPLRAELSRHIADLGLMEVVSMPGYVDADSLLTETDVLCQLSTWENCSYTLLDGLVSHVGVVATDVGGNSDVVAQPNSRAAKRSARPTRRGTQTPEAA